MERLNTSATTGNANKSRIKLKQKVVNNKSTQNIKGVNNKPPQNINFKHYLEQNNYSPREIDPLLIYITLKVLKFIIIGSSIILLMVIIGKSL